jgi:general secretion pathway protein F
MSGAELKRGKPVTLAQLLALNEEIVALVRAGVPLEFGLRQIGPDLRGGLAQIAQELAERLERGENLSTALANDTRFPRVYLAVVEAGIRSGSLTRALESVSAFAQGAMEMRRKLGLTLIYPLLVLLTAYGLFLAFLWEFVPRFQDTYLAFHMRQHGALVWLAEAGRTLPYWGPILPAALALFIGWWLISRQATVPFGDRPQGPLYWIPFVRGILAQIRMATFAEVLALSIEHRLPLPEGLELAASATGDRKILGGAKQLAAAQSGGETLANGARALRVFPPFLRWILSSAQRPETLVPALQQAAQHYRRLAQTRADWLKLAMPLVLILVVGGGATLLYGVALFLPLSQLLTDLGLSEPYGF